MLTDKVPIVAKPTSYAKTNQEKDYVGRHHIIYNRPARQHPASRRDGAQDELHLRYQDQPGIQADLRLGQLSGNRQQLLTGRFCINQKLRVWLKTIQKQLTFPPFFSTLVLTT